MDQKKNQKTTSELGEHRIIEIIEKHLTPMPDIAVPFGDDISAINLDDKRVAVLKTDMLVAKTDIPKDMNLFQAARKAIVMNVSDFASKGVKPTVALVALGLPRHFEESDIEAIAQGLNAGAREYGAYVVGGDTNEATDLIISVSIYGTAEKSRLILRSGAKPGDILAVTGLFGKTRGGLRLLLAGGVTSQELQRSLTEAVLMPKAKLSEGLALAGCNMVTASIDSSDGLALSLNEISRLSNVGFLIDNLPVAKEALQYAESNGLNASDLALYGGEEYELVVTVKPDGWAVAEAAVEGVGGKLLPIGYATEDKQILLDFNGEKYAVQTRGWEHFKSEI